MLSLSKHEKQGVNLKGSDCGLVAGLPSRSSRKQARLRPLGYGAAAFAASRVKAPEQLKVLLGECATGRSFQITLKIDGALGV